MSPNAAYEFDLRDETSAAEFLRQIADVRDEKSARLLARRVAKAESQRSMKASSGTLIDRRKRVAGSSSARARRELRNRIVEELIGQRRPHRDDDITLGTGGALPIGGTRHTRFACIVLGSPASGKSSISAQIADENGAVIIDADFAKRKLPEYDNGRGADLVHMESAQLVEGQGGVFEWVAEQEANLVYVLVGRDAGKVRQLIVDLGELSYDVHLVCTSVTPKVAVARALDRFARTDRYVPLNYIYHDVGAKPQASYRTLVEEDLSLPADDRILRTFGMIDTGGRQDDNKWIECSDACKATGIDCRCRIHEQSPVRIEGA